MRVLIVDDAEDILRLHAVFVRQLGHEANTASSWSEACQVAAAWAPEAVLLDISMPEKNGYDTAPLLRPSLAPPGRIAAVSAFDDEPQARRRAGIDFFEAKPLTRTKLAALLERMRRVFDAP